MNKFTNSQKWFAETVFKDERLHVRIRKDTQSLPPLLAEARNMENEEDWISRQALFLRQGELLADYDDDFEYNGDPVRYYPTYQSLTDTELRGYLSWRGKARQGQFPPGPISFIYLYIYELINNIGVKDAQEGYKKLLEVNRFYAGSDQTLQELMRQWLADYIIYYNFDSSLLAEEPQIVYNQCIGVLEHVAVEPQDKIIDAIKQLSSAWLARSKFYAAHYEDMDEIIYRVLKSMDAHYAKNCKKGLVDQYFGIFTNDQIHLFSRAVFCNPMKRINYEYKVNSQCVYKCRNGIWSVGRRLVTLRSRRKLDKLFKTIDAIMREEYGYGNPIKPEIATKWINATIRSEIKTYLLEKANSEKERLVIDFNSLAQIRKDAEYTQEKLSVEEDEPETFIPPAPAVSSQMPENELLNPTEYKLMQSLLHNEELAWVQQEGLILSVLVDAINEKLYETFGDSVLDDTPALIEDYKNDVKELLHL